MTRGGDHHAYVLLQSQQHKLLAAARDRRPQPGRPLDRLNEANRLLREVADALCLSVFKSCMDNAFKNLL